MLNRIFIAKDPINLRRELKDWLDAEQPTICHYKSGTIGERHVMIVSYIILPAEPLYRAWPGGISASILTAS